MKTNTMTNINPSGRMGVRLRSGFRGILGSVAALAICTTLTAGDDPGGRGAFTRIFSFGDSLSDTGNFYALTGSPPFPYWNGRVSDGPVWTEYLATKLQVPFDPADQYAWLGSTTGDTNFRDVPDAGVFFPGFQQQIAMFLEDTAEDGADPDALYTVWIGANDFFDFVTKPNPPSPGTLISNGVANTVQGIVALAGSGARHFVVGNVPALEITPDIRAFGPETAGLLAVLVNAYNAALEEQLQVLEDVLGIHITRLDSYSVLNQLASEPELFGLTNVTDRALWSFPDVDPSEYLFWDGVHPTTAAHEWTADFVCAELLQTYAPRKARGKGPQNIDALNGLVRAASSRKAVKGR